MKIAAAYEVLSGTQCACCTATKVQILTPEGLSDPKKREAYDALRSGQRDKGGEGGDRSGERASPPPGHENVKYHVRITLEHIYTGGNAEVSLL